ncbi:MAG TPA: hypothetical protein VND15_01660 [Candidatus Acidoferrales bacterium]|nr:hypothetical protein [Candidatus Acidoferrales bacterium]
MLLLSNSRAYAITVPSNVIGYVPVTFTNSQSSGIADPFQVQVAVNSLSYQPREANTLQNVAFFYANGTVVPSWIESNVMNSTVNTIYWLRIVGNFLPSSASNTLYMGFGLNANSLFTSNTGVAPNATSTYGQYDSGFKVFNFYDNFNGVTLGGEWTRTGAATNVISNGLTINGIGGAAITLKATTQSTNPANTVTEWHGHMQGIGLSGKNNAALRNTGASNYQYIWTTQTGSYALANFNSLSTRYSNIAGGSITTNDTWGVWANTINSFISLDYGTPISNNAAFVSFGTAQDNIYAQGSDANSLIVQWTRTRALPPGVNAINVGGVMPTATFATGNLATASVSASNSIIDQGQKEVLTISVPQAIAPITYNFLVTNTVASPANIIATAVYSNSLSSNTFGFAVPINNNALGIDIVTANVLDSSGFEANVTGTITINPQLGSVSLISSNSVPVQGQKITMTYTVSGGSSPYTYNFIATNAVAGNVIASQINTGVSSTSNSFTFILPVTANDLGTITISANVLDGATTNTIVILTNTITVGKLQATLPINIVGYVPITLNNSQSTGIASKFPLQINVNSLNYQPYETNSFGLPHGAARIRQVCVQVRWHLQLQTDRGHFHGGRDAPRPLGCGNNAGQLPRYA